MQTNTLTSEVLDDVWAERKRQDDLIQRGNIPINLADITTGDQEKLAVLVEEIGEVARSINDAPYEFIGDKTHTLYSELIQVAAVSCAWAESIMEVQNYVREATANDFPNLKVVDE